MQSASPAAEPVVYEREGFARTSSRDVAALFAKEHRNVLRDVDALVAAEPGCALNFALTSVTTPMPNGGVREDRAFDMTRDGFTLLAMSFTGAKALRFKLAYMAAFNAMEQRLAGAPVFNIPTTLSGALRLAADQAAQIEVQNHKITHLTPKAMALERIAGTRGSLNLRESAKLLRVREQTLIADLNARRIIYRRPGQKGWLGFAEKEAAGLVEHKHSTVERRDGTEMSVAQVRLTTKLLTRLAEERSGGQPALIS